MVELLAYGGVMRGLAVGWDVPAEPADSGVLSAARAVWGEVCGALGRALGSADWAKESELFRRQSAQTALELAMLATLSMPLRHIPRPLYDRAGRFVSGVRQTWRYGWAAGCTAMLLSWACKSKYTEAPTFCDDWCRATEDRGCGFSDPQGCVRNCELTKASGTCFERQEDLLGCYEETPDEDFVCINDFGGHRVNSETCRTERDTLYECIAPGISTCLGLCRGAQQAQLDEVIDSQTGLYDFSRLEQDAGAPQMCPVLNQPCEDICWSMFAFVSSGLTQQGVQAGVPDAGAGLNGQECLALISLSCFLGPEALPQLPMLGGAMSGGEGLDAGAAPGPGGVDTSALAASLGQCAGLIPSPRRGRRDD